MKMGWKYSMDINSQVFIAPKSILILICPKFHNNDIYGGTGDLNWKFNQDNTGIIFHILEVAEFISDIGLTLNPKLRFCKREEGDEDEVKYNMDIEIVTAKGRAGPEIEQVNQCRYHLSDYKGRRINFAR